MDVAVATDAAYLPWCATTVVSCATANAGEELRFHVLHAPDVTSNDLSRLGTVAREQGAAVEFRPIDEAVVSMFPSKGALAGGRMSWLRVVLPELLPELQRVIYLDADTLVVESTAALWHTDLKVAPLAAVANVTEAAMQAHVTSLGVEDWGYFNAGVLLVDLGRWREEGATDALARFVADHQHLPWFDQDALNAVFAGRWQKLHPRWNAMNSFWMWGDLAAKVFGEEILAQATSRPSILHFEGPSLCKPWHYLCDHPWRSAYRSTLARTPWAGIPLTDRTLVTRLIGRLPAAHRADAYHLFHRLRARARARRLRSPL
jgi:lipopolysaccharide biosynthesis glycosyltransferase